MAPIYQTLAFLSIALSAFAVDVELFKEDSRCEEDKFFIENADIVREK